MAKRNDEKWNRSFKVAKLRSDDRGTESIQRMQIGCGRGSCAKPIESTGAYNFIYTNLPTCKSDRCEFCFTVFQDLDTKRVFVNKRGECQWTHRKHPFVDREFINNGKRDLSTKNLDVAVKLLEN